MAGSRRSNNRKSGSNAGTVFWLGAILIALFIFALNWGKIQETFKRTNFHEIVKTQTGSDAPPPQQQQPEEKPAAKPNADASSDSGSKAPQSAAPKAQDPSAAKSSPQGGAESGAPATKSAPEAAKDEAPKDAKSVPAPAVKSAPAKPRQPSAPVTPSAPAVRNRAASLYFVRIDDDGVIARQEVKRQVPVSDSPLLDALGVLLKGPNGEELQRKLITLIPEGTKLISAQMRGSTAVLNFNEAFMYNHYGIEGYAGQLKQVVFTATAFPNVQDVQILIEGEKHDYLGGEGVYIGKPLSRSSF
jgi:Spore germination protein